MAGTGKAAGEQGRPVVTEAEPCSHSPSDPRSCGVTEEAREEGC